MTDIQTATVLIVGLVQEALDNDSIEVEISADMPLIGGKSALSSMSLVELCLALEDQAAESGFEFDWTSASAMSKSRGMFRSVRSLVNEYVNQYEEQK